MSCVPLEQHRNYHTAVQQWCAHTLGALNEWYVGAADLFSLSDLPIRFPLAGNNPLPFNGESGGGSRSSGVGDGGPPGARSRRRWPTETVLSRAAGGGLGEEDEDEPRWLLSVRERRTHMEIPNQR